MMPPQPPPGQGPVDPRGAFSQPPPPPAGSTGFPQGPAAPMGAGMQGPPPMMMMMPPPYFPPPPPQRGGSFARAIFTTLATSIFGLSIALNIYLLLASGALSSTESVAQDVVVSGDPSQKIAVVKVEGLIVEGVARRFDKVMRRVEEDSSIKALVVAVDTPGGVVEPSDVIYHRLLEFKERKHVPVVVAMGGFATSGGYFISCAADQIVAQRTTWTGNIGVYLDRLDVTKLAEKWNIESTSIYPTSAPYKPMGSPLYPMSPKEHDYLLGLVDDSYATFKDVVNTGRKGKLTAGMDVIANGRVYTAAESMKLGLIDKIGYENDAYDLAASLAGIAKKHVVRFDYAPSLLEALSGGSSAQSSSSTSSVTINGVKVNVDPHMLQEIATPRLMYLWRGQ